MGFGWALLWLGVALIVRLHPPPALAILGLALAVMVFAVGESGFSVENALVADLAPEDIRGRAMALVPISHSVGLSIGGVGVGLLLSASYSIAFLVGAAALVGAALLALRCESLLPLASRRVPANAPSTRAPAAEAA
jgi:MFS family permease